MLKIIIPTLIFSLVISLLPDAFWKRLMFLFEYANILIRPKNSVKLGQELLRTLSRLEADLGGKGNLGPVEIPRYKFYTSLGERILEYGRRFGSPLRSTLLELREAANKDLNFESKIQKELWGGIFQFALISAVTWIFVYLSIYLVQLQLKFKIALIMIFLQGMGFFAYFLFFHFLRERLFTFFAPLFSAYYSLLILTEAGLSIRLSLQESGILNLLSFKDKQFEFLFSRTRELLERWQNKGTPLKGELKEIILSAWSLNEEAFGRFLKLLSALKFLILCLCFLSAYFVYLFHFFHLFLIE